MMQINHDASWIVHRKRDRSEYETTFHAESESRLQPPSRHLRPRDDQLAGNRDRWPKSLSNEWTFNSLVNIY